MNVPLIQSRSRSISPFLDRVCFATAAMGMNIGQELPDLSCHIRAEDSQRTVRMPLPGFITNTSPDDLGDAWQEFCELLKQRGAAVATSVESLTDLHSAAVPIRMGLRLNLKPILPHELATADLFALTLRDESGAWGWPPEIGELARIESFLTSLRQASGNNTPIGIGLPVNARSSDVQMAIRAGADFLHLISRSASVDVCVGVAKARAIAVAQNTGDLPILLDAPVEDEESLVKLLALGASSVSLDAYLKPVIRELRSKADQETQVEAGGMLSSLVAKPAAEKSAKPKLLEVDAKLQAFELQLRDKMNLVGAIDMAGFNTMCLRALDAATSELLGIPKMDKE